MTILNPKYPRLSSRDTMNDLKMLPMTFERVTMYLDDQMFVIQ